MLVQFVRNSITGEPREGAARRRLKSRGDVSPGMWAAGSYDILEMSPAPPSFAIDHGVASSEQVVMTLANGAKRSMIYGVDQLMALVRDGFITKEDAAATMRYMAENEKNRADAIKGRSQATLYPVVVPLGLKRVITRASAPWKCVRLDCKTPTAGPWANWSGICVACSDVEIAKETAELDAKRTVVNARREVAAAPPSAPAMMGGAVSRRGGRWGTWR
jgi:hypothetical protein